MDAGAFEELCCALLDKEADIRTAELYGAPRQPQFGIDVLGQRHDRGTDAVSCKCYGQVRKGEIAGWCEDFLRHWDGHWRAYGVRRFVLAVTAELKSHQRQQEITQQRARFAAIGVELEVWGPRQLQEKLRPHYGVAAQHLGETVADRICGRPQLPVGQPALDALVVGQLSRTQAALTAELDRRLDAARDGLKRGNGADLDRALDEVRNDPERWAVLGPEGRAKILRLRGSRALERGETEEAERIARLQQQLQQFNDPDHIPKPATPGQDAEASGKHDDLVASESSSGEDESESESDMD